MRSIKVIAIAILSLIALTSCQKAFDVNSVHFPNDGGTRTITSSSYTLSIHDRNANYGSGYVDNDIIYAETANIKKIAGEAGQTIVDYVKANAKKFGIELFVLDDGWFGKRAEGFSKGLGDWYVNENKLWNKVGQAYIIVGNKDDVQSKDKNLPT